MYLSFPEHLAYYKSTISFRLQSSDARHLSVLMGFEIFRAKIYLTHEKAILRSAHVQNYRQSLEREARG